MTANSSLENRLIEKVKTLSVEQIQQVENFIDALSQGNRDRQLTVVSTLAPQLLHRDQSSPAFGLLDQLLTEPRPAP